MLLCLSKCKVIDPILHSTTLQKTVYPCCTLGRSHLTRLFEHASISDWISKKISILGTATKNTATQINVTQRVC